MKYRVEYQYRPSTSERPLDETQNLEIAAGEAGATALLMLPNIGDHVNLEKCDWGSDQKMLVVENRLFSYILTEQPEFTVCLINIVLTESDVSVRQLIKE